MAAFSEPATVPLAMIESYNRNFPPVNGAGQLIEKTFGVDIEKITRGNEQYTPVFQRFFDLALDSGLKRRSEFQPPNAEEPIKRESVAMLNRQSFLYELRKRAGFREIGSNSSAPEFTAEKNFRIIALDLKSLRYADEAIDKNQNSAGDYDLNKIADVINQSVDSLARNPEGFGIRKHVDPESILAGRYGGDEFYIAVIGDQFDESDIEAMSMKLTNDITYEKGFFRDPNNHNIIEKKFKIKQEQINIPEDPVERKIYLSFLQRGLVLDNEQIKVEKDVFADRQGIIDTEKLNKYLVEALAREFYPKSIKEDDLDGKIKYLTTIHPELSYPFLLVQHMDKVDPDKTRTKTILNFVENYMVDPLLDTVVMSRFDIVDHINRGEFEEVQGLEVKLKEINDVLSYVTGDQTIIDLWKGRGKPGETDFQEGLRDILKNDIEDGNIRIGRFAGNIFICVNKGKALSQETQIKVSKLTKGIEIRFKDHKIKQFVGHSRIMTGDVTEDTKPHEVKKIMGNIFDMANSDWTGKVLLNLAGDPQLLFRFEKMVTSGYFENFENTDKFALLLSKYFSHPKRWASRIEAANKQLRLLVRVAAGKQPDSERFTQIQSILKGISERKMTIDTTDF